MILCVRAMARPARPPCEAEAVSAAARALGEGRSLSTAKLARIIAREVTDRALADVDRDPADVDAVFAKLMATLRPDQVRLLASSPEIDTAALIRTARLVRFEARGCRHLPEDQWEAENKAVAAEVRDILARRYAKILRRCSSCS